MEWVDTCNQLSYYFEDTESENFADGLGKTGHYLGSFASSNAENLICYQKMADNWNPICDTIENPVSIEPASFHQMGIEIYPQPASEKVLLSSRSGTIPDGTLRIFATNGAQYSLPLQSVGQTFTLDLHDFAAGIYFLQLLTEDGKSLSGRPVIQH